MTGLKIIIEKRIDTTTFEQFQKSGPAWCAEVNGCYMARLTLGELLEVVIAAYMDKDIPYLRDPKKLVE